MAHLFLSYAHKDQDRMLPFHARLENVSGHYVWIDREALKGGDEWQKAIHHAIKSSYGILFAVTEASLQSDYILNYEIPWAMERFDDLPKTQAGIFPIRFDPVSLPKAIDRFQWVDAVERDLDEVIAELKERLPEPVEGGHRFVDVWPRPTTFKGRDTLLRDLHVKLKGTTGRVGVKTAGLHGLGGIGKTQLAVEYAHRYRFHYPAGVYWVNAAESWTREVASLAEHLSLAPADPNAPDRDYHLVAAFHNHLFQQCEDALLILDNVGNPADVPNRRIGPKLRITDLRARLLITTRRQDLPNVFAAVGVDVLPFGDARAVLLDARPSAARDPAIQAICQALGNLPLALGLAAAALRKRPSLAPEKFLAYLQKVGIDGIAYQVRLKHGDLNVPEYASFTVGAALGWHWERLQDENARHLLTLAAAYAEGARIPLARLRLLLGQSADPDSLDQPFDDAIDELLDLNLIERVGETVIRLHPLVRAEVRRRAPSYMNHLADGARLLVAACRVPQTLHCEVAKHGFSAVTADLRETHLALAEGSVTLDQLNRLERFLDWEAHHLRDWVPDDQRGQAYLIQHIRERAHHQGDAPLRDACDAWLGERFPAHLRTADAWRFPIDRALIRVLVGHRAQVRDVVMVDKQRALSASEDGTLRLWNVTTGETLGILEGHTGAVIAATCIDKARVLSASNDRTLRVWDIDAMQALRVLVGHRGGVTAVTMMGEGQALSGSSDGTLRLWDIESGQALRVFELPDEKMAPRAVFIPRWRPAGAWGTVNQQQTQHIPDSFSRQIVESLSRQINTIVWLNQRYVLSANFDKSIRLWDLLVGTVVRTFGERGDPVIVLDEQHVLSASGSTLRLWDLAGEQVSLVLESGNPNSISALRRLDKHSVLSGSFDGTLQLWNIENGQMLRVLEGHTNVVRSVTPVDERQALSASDDTTLRLWDVKVGEIPPALERHTNDVTGVAWVDERRILSVSSDTKLRLWDAQTAQVLQTFDGPDGSLSAVTSLDETHALSGSIGGVLRVWDTRAGRPLRSFKANAEGLPVAALAAVDERRALSASYDWTVRLWDVSDGRLLRVFAARGGWVSGVAIVDRRHLLSAHHDGRLRLWDLETGELMGVLEGHSEAATGVAMLDERRAVSASRDRTLRLWDVRSGQTLRALDGLGGMTAVATVGARHVLAGADDKTLRLWDIEAGRVLAVLHLEETPVCLASRGDGRVVVGDSTGRVRVVQVVRP